MITCECGHLAHTHLNGRPDELYNGCRNCDCRLTEDAVEARYWARKMYFEFKKAEADRNWWWKQCADMFHEDAVIIEQRDAIQNKLNEAVNAMEALIDRVDDDFDDTEESTKFVINNIRKTLSRITEA